METVPTHTWIDVALTAIAALPGVIAAASSLRNGRTLKKNGHIKLAATPKAKKNGKQRDGSADWYEPPNLK